MMENIFNESIKPTDTNIHTFPTNSPEYMIRANIYDFFFREIRKEWGSILEIGPMQEEFTPIKDLFIDTRKELESVGNTYTSLDIDENSNADLLIDFVSYAFAERRSMYDCIIALEVIEHSTDPWVWAAAAERLLPPGGKLFLSTPFYFRVHEPLPDCWRFSSYGLNALFSEYFDLEIKPLNLNSNTKLPLHYTMIGTKHAPCLQTLLR